MSWVQIVLTVISLLRALKTSETKEEMAASIPTAFGDGRLLNFFWENREDIIEFIKTIVGLLGTPSQAGPVPTSTTTRTQELFERAIS